MKLIITTSGNSLESTFDARFGRAAAFCIVDVETGVWSVHPNPALSASGGAGVQAAQFIASLGAQAVASGAYGPNAFNTLAAANITMYLAPGNENHTVADILTLFKAGKLSEADGATNQGHHGG